MNLEGAILSAVKIITLSNLVLGHGDHGDAETLFRWKTIEYDWPSRAAKQTALTDGSFIPLNNAINGIHVYNDRIFVTVPRLRSGIPSNLNTIVKAARSKRFLSSKTVLRPYPSWEMQKQGNCTAFQKVQNIEIDPKRGKLFVIDTGGVQNECPAKLVIYDANSDMEIHRHIFSETVVPRGSNYLNDLVMDYVGGDDVKYLYITNQGDYSIVVYDIENDNSYSFSHPSMRPEENKTDIKILDNVVHVSNGVNGIAISVNFDYVYYSPIAGTGLYQIPTKVLRNSTANFDKYVRKVGDKPSQGDGMIMSIKNSLYFSALAQKAIVMWEIEKDILRYGSEGKVKMRSVTYETEDPRMEWVDSLALDSFGYLWFTTSSLQRHFSNRLRNDTVNFMIWRAFVHEPSYAYFRSFSPAPSASGQIALSSLYLISFILLLIENLR